MEVIFLKKFSRDLDKINKSKDRKSIAEVIQSVKDVQKFEELTGVKKLTGFDDAYRIRSGNYRIGVFLNTTLC